jgi:hypothetical protein
MLTDRGLSVINEGLMLPDKEDIQAAQLPYTLYVLLLTTSSS